MEPPSAALVLGCKDFAANLAFFTGLGFRVDRILPADGPTQATLSADGLRLLLTAHEPEAPGSTLCLFREASDGITVELPPEVSAPNGTRVIFRRRVDPLVIPALQEELVVSAFEGGSWVTGRAGMRYRDLLPSRFGGRFIASHILIPDGGPVPDWVHWHRVRFQMIYCLRGWVRVVYEDQGQPFVLQPGDCVSQPPEIRHRVLESSAGLEVLEIGCPAEHETNADHGMVLPNDTLRPERMFSGQRFVRHISEEAPWASCGHEGFSQRDTGIGAATDGLAGVVSMRGKAGAKLTSAGHQGEFWLAFVSQGSLELRVDDQAAPMALGTASSFALPSSSSYSIVVGADGVDLVVVQLPAQSK